MTLRINILSEKTFSKNHFAERSIGNQYNERPVFLTIYEQQITRSCYPVNLLFNYQSHPFAIIIVGNMQFLNCIHFTKAACVQQS